MTVFGMAVVALGLLVLFGFGFVQVSLLLHTPTQQRLPEPRRRTSEVTHEMARRLRLRVDSSGHLVGRKKRLKVRLIETVGSWEISVWPNCLLPPQTHLRLEVEGPSMVWDCVSGPRTDLLWLVQDEAVMEATRVLAQAGFVVSVQDTAVVTYASGNDLEAGLAHAIDLARAISERRQASVRALVARLGVEPDRYERPDQLDGPGLFRVVTPEVQVVVPWLDMGVWRASVKASLKTPLPSGTWMKAVEEDAEPSVEIGDLIVDSSPVVVQTSDPDALRERICTDGVRGPLLDAICANPGSQLTETGIEVHVVEGALDIDAAVANVLELVEGLG